MTIIYVITDGAYVNCGVVAVTTNKAIAEEFIKVVQDKNLMPEINGLPEEYDLADISGYLPAIKEGYYQWHVKFYHNNEFYISKAEKISLHPNKFATLDAYDYGLVWAKTSEEALALVKEYSKYIEKEV